MGLLRALLLLASGCYTPDLAECAVTCSADTDCATGQACDRGLCAGTGTSCSVPRDGASVVVDATPDDVLPPVDAPPSGMLRIKIADQGRVDVSGIGACDSAISDHCDFVVGLGVLRTLVAIPAGNREFEMWAKTCTGTVPTCEVTPTLPLTEVEAKFRKVDD